MHIWDTFCIALHLDGLQCDIFFGKAVKSGKEVSLWIWKQKQKPLSTGVTDSKP